MRPRAGAQVELLLKEIAEFEMGVRGLEKEMHELNRVEVESAGVLDEEAKVSAPSPEPSPYVNRPAVPPIDADRSSDRQLK